jgi:hypothetical protein
MRRPTPQLPKRPNPNCPENRGNPKARKMDLNKLLNRCDWLEPSTGQYAVVLSHILPIAIASILSMSSATGVSLAAH